MAYKSRLQTNNIDLSAILADINNLPPAGTEDISAELNALSDAVDAHLKMVNRKVAENNGEGEYVWKKLTAEGGDFIDFVVSSDANAYPDGGEQDGYYYELISQPVDLAKELDLIPANIRSGIDIFGVLGTMSEGLSGIDYGMVTFANDSTNSLIINHTLGVIPSMAFLIPARVFVNAVQNRRMYGMGLFKTGETSMGSTYYGWELYYISRVTIGSLTASQKMTATQIDFSPEIGTTGIGRGAYLWVTVA